MVDARLKRFLIEHQLARADEPAKWTQLAGGVSAEIYRVDLPRGTICVKRALAQLKVNDVWVAPISRNHHEWNWIRFAAEHAPQAVPVPLAHSESDGIFAMSFLDPSEYPVWKEQLMAGAIDVQTARQVGTLIARLHAASAGSAAVARTFATLPVFEAIRLEPYLVATGRRHPDLADRLESLARRTGVRSIALAHGDVSPKNILVGPRGPVLLDAECAWYGDPAFDLAFCLTHLLLKCLVHRELALHYLQCFDALLRTYVSGIAWEPVRTLESRAAVLLPALLLARIDGKSPVEYLRDRPEDQALVRKFARPLIAEPPSLLRDISNSWRSITTGDR